MQPPSPCTPLASPPADRIPCCADFAERAPASAGANFHVSGQPQHLICEGRTCGRCVGVLRACGDVQFACCVVCPCACAVLTSGELVRVHLSSQICNLVSEIMFVSHVH